MKKIIITTSLFALFAGATMAKEYTQSIKEPIEEYNEFSSATFGTKAYITNGSTITFRGRGSAGKSGIENVDVFVEKGSKLIIAGHDDNNCWTANSYYVDETSTIEFQQSSAQSKITGNSTFYVKGTLSKVNAVTPSSIAMNEGAHVIIDGGTMTSHSYAIGGVIDVLNGGKFLAIGTDRDTSIGGDFNTVAAGIVPYGTRTEINVKNNSTIKIAGNLNVGLRKTSKQSKDGVLSINNSDATIGYNNSDPEKVYNLNIGWNSEDYSKGPEGGEGYVYVEGKSTLKVASDIDGDIRGDINIASIPTDAENPKDPNVGVLTIGADASVIARNINIGKKGSMLVTLNGSEKQIDASINNAGTLSITAKTGLVAGNYTIANGLTNADNAVVLAYGGTISGNSFTVASAKQVDVSSATQVEVENNGIVEVVADEQTSVVMAFNSEKATVNEVKETTDSFSNEISGDFKAMGAYSFDVSMESTDTVVLSFYVGDSSLSAENFSIFHKTDGSKWSVAEDVSNVQYDGEYLSFIVSHFSEYGFVAVPEPSTYAMILGALALGFAIYRRRK